MKTKLMIFLIGLGVLTQNCNSQDPNFQNLLALAAPAGTTAPVATETTPTTFTVGISDVTGDPGFIFDTTRTVTFLFTVVDATNPNPAGNTIRIVDTLNNITLFKATTNTTGNVSGNFTINNTSKTVQVQLDYQGQIFQFNIDILNVIDIVRAIYVIGSSNVNVYVPPARPDSDGDGIPDDEDQFPNDATRATTIRIPAESFYTIAYEDLFPVKGDADFNDYVVRVINEVDLNAVGEVTYIHGSYQHVARGAGYKHNLFVNMTGMTGGEVTLTMTGGNANCADSTAVTQMGSLDRIELFPGCDSSQTIMPKNGNLNSNTMANTQKGEIFTPGMVSHIDIKLDKPLNLKVLGGAPFDLFLYVINKKKEVHFAGKYFDANGKDMYLDTDGFPWELKIPGDWSWPLERAKIWNAYANFQNWYMSAGKSFADWYNTPDLNNVFTK